MTERVIITGHDLDVEHHTDDDRARLMAKRARLDPTPRTGNTIEHLIGTPNPYWTTEANQAAEENPDDLTPKQLAREWNGHRIEPNVSRI